MILILSRGWTCFKVPVLRQRNLVMRLCSQNRAIGESEIQPVHSIEEIRKGRIDTMEKLKLEGINPFAYSFVATNKAAGLHEQFANLANGSLDCNANVSVAGRIMIQRVFGKLAFFQLQDDSGTIQLYIDKKFAGEKAFESIKKFTDAGDIIGVKGDMKRTDKGELSIRVKEWTMLTKSLLPLPDKYHGLADVNLRYRQRHLDMITNQRVVDTFRTRAKITSLLRRLLDDRGFLEIETPILTVQPGGAEAKPFETFHHSLDMPLTLRIATELHLKRLVIGGIDRVYEIGRIFRNEGLSTRHNPEFTSLELYQAYADYNDMMDITETLITSIAKEVLGTTDIVYGNHSLKLGSPWRRVSMSDLVKEITGMDFEKAVAENDVLSAKKLVELKQVGKKISHQELQKLSSAGEVMNAVFEEYCEDKLIQPTFVMHHPIEISPLAKPHRSLPGVTERFELFVVGRELANAFSELTDPLDQRKRFEKQVSLFIASNILQRRSRHLYFYQHFVGCI